MDTLLGTLLVGSSENKAGVASRRSGVGLRSRINIDVSSLSVTARKTRHRMREIKETKMRVHRGSESMEESRLRKEDAAAARDMLWEIDEIVLKGVNPLLETSRMGRYSGYSGDIGWTEFRDAMARCEGRSLKDRSSPRALHTEP